MLFDKWPRVAVGQARPTAGVWRCLMREFRRGGMVCALATTPALVPMSVTAQQQCLPAPYQGATLHAASGVFVEWVGPHVFGICPEEGVDFTVDCGGDCCEPPRIKLITLRKLAGEISAPVQEYRIGRISVPEECTAYPTGEPRSIRSVKSDWASDQANAGIVVRIGRDPNYRILALLGTPEEPGGPRVAVDIKAPPSVGGNAPWSSVDIKTTNYSFGSGGSINGSVFVEANTANPPIGGRIMGDIADSVGQAGQIGPTDPRIEAYTVGQGADGAEKLVVGGQIVNARFREFPYGARLEAAKLADRSNIVIRGPLNGQMRFGEFIGLISQSQPAKIIVEALDLADPDPFTAPRKVSAGRITVAGGNLSVDPFPCNPCTGVTSGKFANGEIRFDGDFAGQVYAYTAKTNGTDDKAAKVKIGRSMARSEMHGHLKSTGEIRTFEGNHSSTPIEGSLQFMHVDVFGDTEPGSSIQCGGQLNQASFINIHRDHKGIVQVQYFYGNFAGIGNAQVNIFGDLYGVIQSFNATNDAEHSCFRDNGTITVDGDVKPDGSIRLTGNVGPGHLTEVFGDMDGRYVAAANFFASKKYAGRVRIHGSVGASAIIQILNSVDSKRLGLIEMEGADIQIDADVNAPIELGGINDPPCLWIGEGVPSDDETNCVGQGPPVGDPPMPTCSGSPDCTGLFPEENFNDPTLCCLSCSCFPPPFGPCYPEPCCLDQTMAFWEDGIQHRGALVDGKLIIGGKLTSTITLAGDIGQRGSIRIGRIQGGSISLASGAGIQSGGSITVVSGFLSGLIEIPGNVSGPITIGSLAGGIVDIDGSLAQGYRI